MLFLFYWWNFKISPAGTPRKLWLDSKTFLFLSSSFNIELQGDLNQTLHILCNTHNNKRPARAPKLLSKPHFGDTPKLYLPWACIYAPKHHLATTLLSLYSHSKSSFYLSVKENFTNPTYIN